MTEEQILKLIIGLIETGDATLLDPGMLNQMEIPETKHSIVIELRGIIERIFSDYSYLQSPRFQASILGKSASVQAMKRKFEDEPVKRSRHRNHMSAALAAIMNSSEAYDLLTTEQHPLLDRIRILANALSNTPLL